MLALTFLAPHWLWGLAALPLLALVRGRVRVAGHALLRAAVLAALLVGLARPVLWTEDAREHAVFVVDASPSVSRTSGTLQAVASAARKLPKSVITTLVVFGAEGPPRSIEPFDRIESVGCDGSSVSSALALAAAAIPSDARGSITLATDGLATDERWTDALLALQARGIPVHTVTLAQEARPVRVVSMSARGPLRIGHTGEIEVTLAGDVADANLRLASGASEIALTEVALRDARASVALAWEPKTVGYVTLTATVESNGATHALTRTFAVQDPLHALYLGERVQGASERLAQLVGPGLAFETWAPSDGDSRLELERYDVVVLDDLPAEALGAERQAQLARSVVDRGLGLVASGGEAAFGPGGYHRSTLAEVLPVESVQKEEKRDPSTTLVIIIDTSGSMGGERIQLAKEVARLGMARLLPHDKVGIVEFYGAKRWAAPIQPASNSIDLARAINRMDAGGGTVILPAIEEAFYGLQNVQTRYKHVLVLTDGGVETGAFEPLLRRMADEGINTSTVLIGPEAHSEFLVNIANWGKGRFYSAPDRFNLPEVLLKQPTSSRLPAYKPGNFALDARGGAGWWGAVERADVPAVGGYVETKARAGAEVLLEVRDERDPLLATWRYGLGRVTTFTSELVGPGTEPWRAWPGYGALLARVLARTADDGRDAFDFRLTRRADRLELLARRRRPGSERPAAQVVDAAEVALRELAFDERAEGVFRARWTADPDAEVRVLASVADSRTDPRIRLVSNPRADEGEELAVDPLDALDLTELAASTGGERVPAATLAAFVPGASRSTLPRRLVELAPLAYALALLAYLFEIFHRRRDVRRAQRP